MKALAALTAGVVIVTGPGSLTLTTLAAGPAVIKGTDARAGQGAQIKVGPVALPGIELPQGLNPAENGLTLAPLATPAAAEAAPAAVLVNQLAESPVNPHEARMKFL